MRAEEFRADKMATGALPPKQIIAAWGELIQGDIWENGSHEAIERLKQTREAVYAKLEKESPDPSREDRMFCLALALAEEAPKRSLASILSKPYPTTIERVKNLAPTVER